MNNQEEILEDKQIREQLNHAIRLGNMLERLKKNQDFKELIDGVFLETGLDILWKNTRHLREEQLKGRGNDKNLEVLDMLEGQIKSRLDFDGFLDTVEHDYINAAEELKDMNSKDDAKSGDPLARVGA